MPRRKKLPPGAGAPVAETAPEEGAARPASRAPSDATTAASSQTDEDHGSGSESAVPSSDDESVTAPRLSSSHASTGSAAGSSGGSGAGAGEPGGEESSEATDTESQAETEQSDGEAAGTKQLQSFRGEMLAIYRVHNPRKVDDVDELLEQWQGDEDELIANIRAKYGIASSHAGDSEAGDGGSSTSHGSGSSSGNDSGQNQPSSSGGSDGSDDGESDIPSSSAGFSAEEEYSGSEVAYSEDSEVLRQRSELISDAKVFRVKLTRDGAGRLTYNDIYVPHDEEGKDRSGIVDPRVIKQQAFMEKTMLTQDGEDPHAARERQRERRRIRRAKKSEALWAMRERVLATEDVTRGDGARSGRPALKLWQQKLRERWERPINEETGREIPDPPMVAALKARHKERREAERAQQDEQEREKMETAEAEEYAKQAAAASQYTYAAEDADEEQELYPLPLHVAHHGIAGFSLASALRVIWSRYQVVVEEESREGNSFIRLNRVVRHQRRAKLVSDPRQIKNQLVVDALAQIEPQPEPELEGAAVVSTYLHAFDTCLYASYNNAAATDIGFLAQALALDGFKEAAPQLQFPLTKQGFPDDSGEWDKGRATRDLELQCVDGRTFYSLTG